jgi:hypothetical protein
MLSVHFPEERRTAIKQRAYRRLVRSHSRRAFKLLQAGSPQLAVKQIESARAASERLSDDALTRWMKSRLLRVEARVADHFAYTPDRR